MQLFQVFREVFNSGVSGKSFKINLSHMTMLDWLLYCRTSQSLNMLMCFMNVYKENTAGSIS